MLAKDKFRPLWIILSSRWGGPEQVAVSDLVEMAHAGIPMNLLCLAGTPVHAAAVRHPHIHVRTVEKAPGGLWDLGFARDVRSLVAELKAGILHINDETLLWYLLPSLVRMPKTAVVVSRYSTSDGSWMDLPRRFWLRRLDYMIVLSSSIKERVVRRFRIREKKIKIINLGLDLSRFDPTKSSGEALRASWGADERTIVIGSLGRLAPEFGQDTFLKAAAGLLKHTKWKLKFAIISEDPLLSSAEYLEGLRRTANQFRMEEDVIFGSVADNLPEIMRAFDIYAMPGREDVPGLGALEALAMERPVVLSRVVGAEDIVGSSGKSGSSGSRSHAEQYGLLVRAEDAFDLQQKLFTLLENPERRVRMGVEGRVHVLKNFNKSMRFQRSLDVYEKCIRRRSRL